MQLKVYDFEEDLLPSYSADSGSRAAFDPLASPGMTPIDMLRMAVPGQPGQDYPILAEVPDTAFSCDGRVDGGKELKKKKKMWDPVRSLLAAIVLVAHEP